MVGLRDVSLTDNLRHPDVLGEREIEMFGVIKVIGGDPNEFEIAGLGQGDGGGDTFVVSPPHSEVCFVYYYALIQSPPKTNTN